VDNDVEHFYLTNIHHLSKFLILTGNAQNDENIQESFKNILNFAQIYEENQRVILRSFYRTKNLTTFQIFESSQHENLSEILFPDKSKNLNKFPLYVAFAEDFSSVFENLGQPLSKWMFFTRIVAEKLNATLQFVNIPVDLSNLVRFHQSYMGGFLKLIEIGEMDFLLNKPISIGYLESYNYLEFCFMVPLPPEYSIYELILFLPLDINCWMWLGITVAVSSLVWRIFEGHWGFLFGAFAQFVGQFVEIKT
jgi:hypothetical protein